MNGDIIALVRDTLVAAGSTFRPDKKAAYAQAIARERSDKARWVLQTILDNAPGSNAEILELDSLQSADTADEGRTYLSAMEDNLFVLTEALG